MHENFHLHALDINHFPSRLCLSHVPQDSVGKSSLGGAGRVKALPAGEAGCNSEKTASHLYCMCINTENYSGLLIKGQDFGFQSTLYLYLNISISRKMWN